MALDFILWWAPAPGMPLKGWGAGGWFRECLPKAVVLQFLADTNWLERCLGRAEAVGRADCHSRKRAGFTPSPLEQTLACALSCHNRAL